MGTQQRETPYLALPALNQMPINLYNALKNVVVTKADLAEFKTDLTWRIIIVAGISTAVNSAVVTIVTLL